MRRIHAQVAPYARRWEESNERALAADASGPLWVVLGDSTAQGVGAPSHLEGYVGQVLRRLDREGLPRAGRSRILGPWRILNWSRSGARAHDVLTTQLSRLDAFDRPYDLLTIAIGANDIYRTPLDRLIAELRAIIRRLPPGAVMGTIPQGLRPPKAQAANAVIRVDAPAAGLVVADVWERTGLPWRGKFSDDSFHPNAVGYGDWADAFSIALGLGPPPSP